MCICVNYCEFLIQEKHQKLPVVRHFPNPAAGYGKLLPAPVNFQIPSWLHILGNCLDSNQERNMHKCNWAVSVARTLWSNWQAWKLHSESWSFNKEIIITIYCQIVPLTENPSPCKQYCPNVIWRHQGLHPELLLQKGREGAIILFVSVSRPLHFVQTKQSQLK